MQQQIRSSDDIKWDSVNLNGVVVTGAGTNVTPNSSDLATWGQLQSVLSSALIWKGTIDCSGTPNCPAATAGWEYIVSAAGKFGGPTGQAVGIGDVLICKTTNGGGDWATVGAFWNYIESATPTGMVISESTSVVANSIVKMYGTTGNLVQTSSATIDSNGSINIPTGQNYKINGSQITFDNIAAGSTNVAFTSTMSSKLAGISAGADVTASALAAAILAATPQGSLVDSDSFPIQDASNSNHLAQVTLLNLKTYIKSDTTLAGIISASHTQGTDSGTTQSAFLIDSGSSIGKLNISVATNVGHNNTMTLTNALLTNNVTITIPNPLVGFTDTLALISQVPRIVMNEIPAGTCNSTNGTNGNAYFSFGVNPTSLMLWKDGILMIPGSGNDYVLSNNTITFQPGSVPMSTAILQTLYTY